MEKGIFVQRDLKLYTSIYLNATAFNIFSASTASEKKGLFI